MTVTDAAALLGTTEGALRKRIARGTLPHERDAEGRVWVLLDRGARRADAGRDAGHPGGRGSPELVDELRDRIRYLERQVEEEREAAQEPQEAPGRAPEGQDTGQDAAGTRERPWWRRLMGG